jgi:hypothetical protein
MSVVAAGAQPRIPDVENELWLAPAPASHPADFLPPFRSFLFDSSRMPSGALHSGNSGYDLALPAVSPRRSEARAPGVWKPVLARS